MLESTPDLFDLFHAMLRDADDYIVRWGKSAERFYGWSAEEAVGRVSHELLRTRFPVPLDTIRPLAKVGIVGTIDR